MNYHNNSAIHRLNRDMQELHERISKFPHQFVNNVCQICGKHEITEWIGGGCVKAYQLNKASIG